MGDGRAWVGRGVEPGEAMIVNGSKDVQMRNREAELTRNCRYICILLPILKRWRVRCDITVIQPIVGPIKSLVFLLEIPPRPVCLIATTAAVCSEIIRGRTR